MSAGPVAAARAARWEVPPVTLVFVAILSLQLGSAAAKQLFPVVGASGAVALRVGLGALVLLALWRPRLRGHGRRQYALAAAFGLTTVLMNLSFYAALERLPLGVAVTLEFLGPLGVAVASSRRARDFVWAACASAGIGLFSPVGAGSIALDPGGVLFALGAAVFWAGYILLSARAGDALEGGSGLVLAMLFAAALLLPFGAAGAPALVAQPGLLLFGAAVAVLSCALPYSCEFAALRRMPTYVFGILMSMEPVVAAAVGWLLLREHLTPRALVAIALVTVAAVGASWGSRKTKAERRK